MNEREQTDNAFIEWAAENLPGATLTEFAAAKFAWRARGAIADPERKVPLLQLHDRVSNWLRTVDAYLPENVREPILMALAAAKVALAQPSHPAPSKAAPERQEKS